MEDGQNRRQKHGTQENSRQKTEKKDRKMEDRNFSTDATESMIPTFVDLHKSTAVGGADLVLGQPLQVVRHHSPLLGRLQEETTRQVDAGACRYLTYIPRGVPGRE